MRERRIDLQNLEELGNVGTRCTTLRADADALAIEFIDRADAGFLANHELKRRIIHRKECAHGPQLFASRPRARSVPALQSNAKRNKPDLDLAGLQQEDVLPRTLARPSGHRKVEGAGQNTRKPFAIGVLGASRRGRADRQRRRPVRLDGLCRPGTPTTVKRIAKVFRASRMVRTFLRSSTYVSSRIALVSPRQQETVSCHLLRM